MSETSMSESADAVTGFGTGGRDGEIEFGGVGKCEYGSGSVKALLSDTVALPPRWRREVGIATDMEVVVVAMLGGRVSWRRKDLGVLTNGSVSWGFSLFYQVICSIVNLLRFLPSFFSFAFFRLLCYALLR